LAGRAATGIALAAALAAVFIGIRYGTYTAGDSDPYGYVSEADLIAHGSLRVEQQFARTMPWPLAEWTFAPLGYRPAPARGFIVPTYPAGLPLGMALFERVTGRNGVFYLVPLLGALAILATWRLGAAIYGEAAGISSAALLAASPTFLLQLIQPVSDVPAAAWWALSLALLVHDSPASAFASGLAASVAIVTRPNLVPLAGLMFVFLAKGREMRRLVSFTSGVVPGCIAVAVINAHLYGSALRSGYAQLHTLYAWSNAGPNLDRYPRWFVSSETPFMCLALAAPWLQARNRVGVKLLLAFAVVVFVSYLFYIPFGRDDVAYLRFLLPAYPALLVLSVGAAIELAMRFGVWRAALTIAGVCTIVALVNVRTAAARHVLALRDHESRYVDLGRYVAQAMPQNALFVSGLHCGSIRYYSGRLTLRYDLLQPGWLDEAIRTLRSRGYHPYIALEEGEEPDFRQQFEPFSALARLDWPPAAERREPVRVRIYDPADRARFLAGEGIVTGDIRLVAKPRITKK
jgi:hypothetical protein